MTTMTMMMTTTIKENVNVIKCKKERRRNMLVPS
jgi:hypothetical protein